MISVVIASPGDVAAEREIVERAIHRWNAMFSRDQNVVLMPLQWETSAAPEMGASAQTIINRQMITHGDILIGVFWTRLGTPTADHASGTAEEIDQFLESGRPASLFFSTMPVVPGSIDQEQWQALMSFKDNMGQRGLLGTFESHGQLADAVMVSLNHHVQQLGLSNDASERPPPNENSAANGDVRATFVALGGGSSILSLSNYGAGAAHDVTVTTHGVSDADRSWSILGSDEPIPVLASGSTIDLHVALDFGSPPRVIATVAWTNDDGSAATSIDTLAM